MRRLTAVLTIAAGLWLLAMVPLFSLFGRTSAAENVTDAFRTTMSHAGLQQLASNYASIRGLGVQYVGEARPELARDLGLSVAQLDQRFPALGEGARSVPPAIELVDPVVPRLAAAERDFSRVDDLPGLGLPITALPWIVLGLGAALIGAGVLALRGASLLPVAGVLVLGVAIVAGAFAFSLPAKFRATDRILPVARVALSQKAADTATGTVRVVDAMTAEVADDLVPALASKLGTTDEAVLQQLGERYPDVAAGLQEWPRIKPGAAALAAAQRATVDDLREGDGAPFRTLPWLVIGPVALVALAAAAALAGLRRPARVSAGVPRTA